MNRRARSRLGALLLLVAAFTGIGAPALADSGRVLVAPSEDGPYADQLPTPLLGGQGRLVPLDEAGGTFFVKNSSSRVARVTVAVVDRGPANELSEALTFVVDVAGTTSTGSLRGDRCGLVTTGPDLAPGGVQPAEVSFVFEDTSGQRAMQEQVALDVDVTLSEVVPGGRVDVCGEQSPAGPAPDCDRTTVTLVGRPACPPTAADAGLGGDGPWGDAGGVAGSSLLLLLAAVPLLAWLRRRAGTGGPPIGHTS